MNFIAQKFAEGGVFMYFILLCGIFALSIGIERFVVLYLTYKKPVQGFRNQMLNYLTQGDFAGALNFAAATATTVPLSRIVAQAAKVRARHGGDEELQARMDEQLSHEIAAVDKRTGFLGMLGNVSTLIGLLGTISGMITSFAAVAQANPMDRATLLSKGISEAMNCTAFGLVVAIPALVTYAFFQNRTDRIVTELTENTTKIYNDFLYFSEAENVAILPPPPKRRVQNNVTEYNA